MDIAAEDLIAIGNLYFVMDGYAFVAYVNRNLVFFKEFYKIFEAKIVIRGLLKYDRNLIFIKAFADISGLDAIKKDWLMTWTEIYVRIKGANNSSKKYVTWMSFIRDN